MINYKQIEKKWQQIWEENNAFVAEDFSSKPKFYSLVEFPYPSGAGLHLGHLRAYTSLEIISRKRRLEGYNVMFPMGWDAFGLPTENYAIKNNISPRVATDQNIRNMKRQLKEVGYSFDWSREVDTTDENYYKWTQWIFIQLFKNGLAYKSKSFVNYCENCKVVLANEESQGGVCDRCHSQVVQKEKNVWFLKIKEYSEKLLKGLTGVDFTPRIKEEQINWIGKSTGAEINFTAQAGELTEDITVYTTRPDTLFGVTFLVLSPEHGLVERFKHKITNLNEVEEYQLQAKLKNEFERVHMNKEKTGVKLLGVSAVHPVTKKLVPIFISDYVVMGYGTGAIMAVPAHDTRDYEFAKKFDIDIIEVISGGDISKEAFTDIESGIMVNSEFLNGLSVKDAIAKITDYLTKNNLGHEKTNYLMKDWAFNRQRYWGEPIPIVYCDKCGTVPVNESDLPLKLPEVETYKPSEDGESPLAQITDWVTCKCPKCGGNAVRETDTMPQWAGSSWYFLRYIDPKNNLELASKDKLNYWGQVDWYNGGMEHVTRHLIYSRFWNMFLNEIGVVPFHEPYKKRTAQGLLLGEDGQKMSKSLGNVVNPDDLLKTFGSDITRVYIMFMGDYESYVPWSNKDIIGCKRFIERVWKLEQFVTEQSTEEENVFINQTINKVDKDVEQAKYNTAIAALMEFVNFVYKQKSISKENLNKFLTLLYPYAPHITEEANQKLGFAPIYKSAWPKADEQFLVQNKVELPVQVNGKVKGKILVKVNEKQENVLKLILTSEFGKGITEAAIKKVVYVPNRIVNLII